MNLDHLLPGNVGAAAPSTVVKEVTDPEDARRVDTGREATGRERRRSSTYLWPSSPPGGTRLLGACRAATAEPWGGTRWRSGCARAARCPCVWCHTEIATLNGTGRDVKGGWKSGSFPFRKERHWCLFSHEGIELGFLLSGRLQSASRLFQCIVHCQMCSWHAHC